MTQSQLPESKAASTGVAGIVVTFHPDEHVLKNLEELRPQVELIVVVDNGSNPSELQLLRTACELMHIHLIENGANLGIATGLNIGVRRGLQAGMQWIILFDQDSRVQDGFIGHMVQRFQEREHHEPLGLLAPLYLDMRSGNPIHGETLHGRNLEVAMTSGSLLRATTFERCGFFVDGLFIDVVDHEYSLRLRRAGLTIEECDSAVLLHSPGAPAVHYVFGKRFLTSNYSPLRRYYQERNKIWVARRYFSAFPKFCLGMFFISAKDFIKILFVEPEPRIRKLRFFLLGVWDGLLGRTGPLQIG